MQGYGALDDRARRQLWLGIRFAPALCLTGIALGIAVAFRADASTLAWILAVPLLGVATTVTTTNWCLPSFIYGLLHQRTGEAPA
jgi:hypothetical protein